MREWFNNFAWKCADAIGSVQVFIAAVVLTLIWAALGPPMHFSDSWQLSVNTPSTVVTTLAVFLVQNTQNRDAKATHKKLDALIAANDRISNHLIGIERPEHEDGDIPEVDEARAGRRAEGEE